MEALSRRFLSVLVLMLGQIISTPSSVAASITQKPGPESLNSTFEGKVTFAGKSADTILLEITAGGSRIIAELPQSADLSLSDFLNRYVRVIGALEPAHAADGFASAGRLLTNTNSIHFLPAQTNHTLLATTEEVHALSPEQAAAKQTVRIRGVITSRDENGGMVQDATRGVYVFNLKQSDNGQTLRVADYVEIAGATERGTFAPMIICRSAKHLGRGVLPDPIRPTWERLNNGSMDCQYVEIEAFVTEAHDSTLVLLLPEGHFGIALVPDPNAPLARHALHPFANKNVRIRGTVFATRDNQTHCVRAGSIGLGNATIGLGDAVLTLDKKIGALLQFDARAAGFHRVRVSGQILHARDREYYLSDGVHGLRFVAKNAAPLIAGDRVEVVGFPRLAGSSPVIVEATARKLTSDALPSGQPVALDQLSAAHVGSMIKTQCRLVGVRTNRAEIIFDLQATSRTLVARLEHNRGPIFPLLSIPIGALLELRGVYAGHSRDRITGAEADSSELLLNAATDVRILERPSWWTPRRALALISSLLGALLLGAAWVVSLRRKVEARTQQLQTEIERRKRVQAERLIEAERARLARDLHDELGSRITEISLLANVGAGAPPSLDRAHQRFQLIADKAGDVVDALDVIVWAVNPATDALQPLADYVSSFVREFLSTGGIRCRLKVPIQFPDAAIDSHTRHNLFLAVKETLNNIARHSCAREVEFKMAIIDHCLEISIADKGIGFDPAQIHAAGMGLQNLKNRLESVGGQCSIQSVPGQGTTVTMLLPLRPDGTNEQLTMSAAPTVITPIFLQSGLADKPQPITP